MGTFVIEMYEAELRRLNPKMPKIRYDVSELLKFLDTFVDLSVLVFDAKTSQYAPHDTSYVKNTVSNLMRAQLK